MNKKKSPLRLQHSKYDMNQKLSIHKSTIRFKKYAVSLILGAQHTFLFEINISFLGADQLLLGIWQVSLLQQASVGNL